MATDVARAATKMTYAEPSQGVAAVAMLVSDKPDILQLDFGANGYHGYEVMDTCRPEPNIETGDPDLSLLSYLDCLENSYRAYMDCVEEADFVQTFDYLAFHTPFAGMVKGAHRNMMRKFKQATPAEIELDFQKRIAPSLSHCVQVGNVYSATLYLALCSLIATGQLNSPKRVGLYSYGSGCSAEFYSGIISAKSQAKLAEMKISEALAKRYSLSMERYDQLLDLNMQWQFGVKNKSVDINSFADIYESQFQGKDLLVLRQVADNYHRKYEWS